jgi:hypothetical protein
MRLNTAGTSINTSLYVSGLTILNNTTTCRSSLNVSGNTILNNSLIVGNNNSYPTIQLGSTNGYNLGVATTANSFSTSAATGDTILRTTGNTRLLLQSGGGGYGIMIDANNYVAFNKKLVNNLATSDTKTVIENLIINSGAVLTGVFGGDTIITGHWGVAINLNYGGFANGYGAGDNSQSYVPGWSAFTINTRTSTSQTTFDKRLLTVMPDGNTTINGNLNCNNITLGSAGKINSGDDNHYIQIDATTDTLTIQEYGTISFNIGSSKTQKAYVAAVGMFVSGKLGVNNYPDYPLQVNGGSWGGFTNVFVRT